MKKKLGLKQSILLFVAMITVLSVAAWPAMNLLSNAQATGDPNLTLTAQSGFVKQQATINKAVSVALKDNLKQEGDVTVKLPQQVTIDVAKTNELNKATEKEYTLDTSINQEVKVHWQDALKGNQILLALKGVQTGDNLVLNAEKEAIKATAKTVATEKISASPLVFSVIEEVKKDSSSQQSQSSASQEQAKQPSQAESLVNQATVDAPTKGEVAKPVAPIQETTPSVVESEEPKTIQPEMNLDKIAEQAKTEESNKQKISVVQKKSVDNIINEDTIKRVERNNKTLPQIFAKSMGIPTPRVSSGYFIKTVDGDTGTPISGVGINIINELSYSSDASGSFEFPSAPTGITVNVVTTKNYTMLMNNITNLNVSKAGRLSFSLDHISGTTASTATSPYFALSSDGKTITLKFYKMKFRIVDENGNSIPNFLIQSDAGQFTTTSSSDGDTIPSFFAGARFKPLTFAFDTPSGISGYIQQIENISVATLADGPQLRFASVVAWGGLNYLTIGSTQANKIAEISNNNLLTLHLKNFKMKAIDADTKKPISNVSVTTTPDNSGITKTLTTNKDGEIKIGRVINHLENISPPTGYSGGLNYIATMGVRLLNGDLAIYFRTLTLTSNGLGSNTSATVDAADAKHIVDISDDGNTIIVKFYKLRIKAVDMKGNNLPGVGFTINKGDQYSNSEKKVVTGNDGYAKSGSTDAYLSISKAGLGDEVTQAGSIKPSGSIIGEGVRVVSTGGSDPKAKLVVSTLKVSTGSLLSTTDPNDNVLTFEDDGRTLVFHIPIFRVKAIDAFTKEPVSGVNIVIGSETYTTQKDGYTPISTGIIWANQKATFTYPSPYVQGGLRSIDSVSVTYKYSYTMTYTGARSQYAVLTAKQLPKYLEIDNSDTSLVIKLHGAIGVKKVDAISQNFGLQNATFTATGTATNPDVKVSGRTNTNGFVSFDDPLTVGTSDGLLTFYLKESTAPKGYILHSSSYIVKMSEEDGIISVVDASTNAPDQYMSVENGYIKMINKQSPHYLRAKDQSGAAITGAVLTLKSGATAKSYTTGSDGSVEVATLPVAVDPGSSASFDLKGTASGNTASVTYSVTYSSPGGFTALNTSDSLISLNSSAGDITVTFKKYYVKAQVLGNNSRLVNGGTYKVGLTDNTTTPPTDSGSYTTAALSDGKEMISDMETLLGKKIVPARKYQVAFNEATTPTGFAKNSNVYSNLTYTSDKGFEGTPSSDKLMMAENGNAVMQYQSISTDPYNPNDPTKTRPSGGTGNEGPLSLDYIPATLNFGSKSLKMGISDYALASEETSAVDNKIFAQVTDRRAGITSNRWKLSLKTADALKDSSGRVLTDAKLDFKNGKTQHLLTDVSDNAVKWDEITALSNILSLDLSVADDTSSIPVMDATSAQDGTRQILWNQNDVALKVNGDNARIGQSYSSKLDWTLSAEAAS